MNKNEDTLVDLSRKYIREVWPHSFFTAIIDLILALKLTDEQHQAFDEWTKYWVENISKKREGVKES